MINNLIQQLTDREAPEVLAYKPYFVVLPFFVYEEKQGGKQMEKKRYPILQAGEKIVVLTDEGKEIGTFEEWTTLGENFTFLHMTYTFIDGNKLINDSFYVNEDVIETIQKLV